MFIKFYNYFSAHALHIRCEGCDCNSKWKVTLPDGRSCIGKIHYSGKGRTDFHCDNGVIFVNVTNANLVRY